MIAKIKITGKSPTAGSTKDVEVAVPLKHLSNFWRTLEVLLINCETDPVLTWSADCVISSVNGETTFAITDTKLYAPVVTLSIQDNAKLYKKLESGFKRIINWNKYQPKVSTERQNQYLDLLIDPSFQGVSRLSFILWKWEQ